MLTKENYIKLFEKAMSLTENDIIYFKDTHKTYEIILSENNKVKGYIKLLKSKHNYYQVDRVAAEPGYGPLMHDLAMNCIYPAYLRPSDLSKEKAIGVFKYYLANRHDVIHKDVSENEIHYYDSYRINIEDDPRTDEETLSILNKLYQLKPTDTFYKIKKINGSDLFKQMDNYFDSKYVAESKQVIEDVKDKAYLLINNKVSSVEFLITDKSTIFGYAELIKYPTYYLLVNGAAISGYGPLLFDTIMQYLTLPVRPSSSMTTAALTVWQKYYSVRTDVIKIRIDVTSELYWDAIDLDQQITHDKKYLNVINSVYTMNLNKLVNDWVKTSQVFENEMSSKLKNWKQIRFNAGKQWFNKMYI